MHSGSMLYSRIGIIIRGAYVRESNTNVVAPRGSEYTTAWHNCLSVGCSDMFMTHVDDADVGARMFPDMHLGGELWGVACVFLCVLLLSGSLPHVLQLWYTFGVQGDYELCISLSHSRCDKAIQFSQHDFQPPSRSTPNKENVRSRTLGF